jgi:hypothetical protein
MLQLFKRSLFLADGGNPTPPQSNQSSQADLTKVHGI